MVREYKQDKLVHRKISAGLATWIIEQGKQAISTAEQWQKPSLLMYAGQDRLVNPQGSALFAKKAPPDLLHTLCFNVMYHEIFNDPERGLVLTKMIDWLDRRYA